MTSKFTIINYTYVLALCQFTFPSKKLRKHLIFRQNEGEYLMQNASVLKIFVQKAHKLHTHYRLIIT